MTRASLAVVSAAAAAFLGIVWALTPDAAAPPPSGGQPEGMAPPATRSPAASPVPPSVKRKQEPRRPPRREERAAPPPRPAAASPSPARRRAGPVPHAAWRIEDGKVIIENHPVTVRYPDGRMEVKSARIVATPAVRPVTTTDALRAHRLQATPTGR